MNQVVESTFQILILVFSIVIHEVSHGAVAYAMGDETAKNAGRLTLNPISHIDLFGSILLPALMILSGGPAFGWAKPVPYNPYYLTGPKWLGRISPDALVGIAGPAANIFLAIFFGLMVRFGAGFGFPAAFIQIAIFIVFMNLGLAIFNLIPIPPLDGSKLLFAFLPDSARSMEIFFERWGFMLILIFIFFLSGILIYPIYFFFRLITGMAF
ncbi:MAG: site-2 protease family protein [bacterium]|nr:site-2 protease family protein [bacterium]